MIGGIIMVVYGGVLMGFLNCPTWAWGLLTAVIGIGFVIIGMIEAMIREIKNEKGADR